MNEKMMYLVFEDWCDNCDEGQSHKLFDNYKKAKEYFENCIIENKDFVDCENEVIDKQGDSYEAYEEGYYSSNHYRIEIKKMEVCHD